MSVYYCTYIDYYLCIGIYITIFYTLWCFTCIGLFGHQNKFVIHPCPLSKPSIQSTTHPVYASCLERSIVSYCYCKIRCHKAFPLRNLSRQGCFSYHMNILHFESTVQSFQALLWLQSHNHNTTLLQADLYHLVAVKRYSGNIPLGKETATKGKHRYKCHNMRSLFMNHHLHFELEQLSSDPW